MSVTSQRLARWPLRPFCRWRDAMRRAPLHHWRVRSSSALTKTLAGNGHKNVRVILCQSTHRGCWTLQSKVGRQYLNLSQPYLTLSRRYLTKYALKSFKSSKIVASCYLRTQFESLVRSLSLECSRTFQECSRSHELIRDDYFWPRDVAVGPHFQPHFDR